MPQCKIHLDTYYPPNGQCILCLRGQSATKRFEEKTVQQSENTFNKKKVAIVKQQEKRKENTKLIKEILAKNPNANIIKPVVKSRAELKKELQSLVSKHFKKFCKDNNLYYCWITKQTENKTAKGFFKLHTYHYFAKSIYWPLWDRKANLGLSVYDQNINKQYNVAAIRPMLIKIHGLKEVEKLEKDQQEIDLKIHQGLIKKYVPTDWLLAKIIELKRPDYILK